MKKIILFMMFMVLISSALAQNALVEEFSNQLEGQKMSGPLGTLFGDEKINFHLETDDGIVIVGILTEAKIVKSIEEGKLEKPSLNIYADESTIMEVQRSENPLQTLKEALDDGRIRYEAVGFFNKIKFSFLSVFSNIASLFMSGEEESEKIHKEDVVEGISEPEKLDESEDLGDEDDEEENNEEEMEPEENNLLTGEVTAEVEPENKEHIIKLTLSGFDPYEIDVEVGDTVTWKNVRKGSNFNQGMIIGVRECMDVRSGVLEPGEEYSYTFEESVKCTIVDGIWTTEDSKVNVE